MNEELFISKVKESVEQTRRRINVLKAEVIKIEEWLDTLNFFVKKREEEKVK